MKIEERTLAINVVTLFTIIGIVWRFAVKVSNFTNRVTNLEKWIKKTEVHVGKIETKQEVNDQIIQKLLQTTVRIETKIDMWFDLHKQNKKDF